MATARTSSTTTGALPAVEQASIRQDLYRRDFTINAMAVSLKGEDFGRLVDYFGGHRDLEGRVIRVLHNLSFIDDPTRIFRAIRYENRYGFRMDAHTLALARACGDSWVSCRARGCATSSRISSRRSASRTPVRRLAELGIDRAVHARLAADDRWAPDRAA